MSDDWLAELESRVDRQAKRVSGQGEAIALLKGEMVKEVERLREYAARLIEECEDKDEELGRYKRALAEWTGWEPGVGPKEKIRPGHGPCCTCQECGYPHDECVCDHNEIEAILSGENQCAKNA